MTGPQDPPAAGGGRLRVGHADREQVIETLKDAFVHGRLTKDELDARAGQALTARTHAELAALTADIPPAAAPAGAGPGAPSAAGQGGRRIRRLPGHRGRRHVARRNRRSGRHPRPHSCVLGAPVPSRGPGRRSRGTVHLGARGGRPNRAETLPQAAAPAGAGRPRPGRRPARRHRPCPGSPRPRRRPGPPRRAAGLRVAAAPAARSRPPGRAGHRVA